MSNATGKEMCELIAAVAKERDGIEVEPEAIWNASPTGELAHVFLLYQDAKEWRERQKEEL
jgi:hypothetical protein